MPTYPTTSPHLESFKKIAATVYSFLKKQVKILAKYLKIYILFLAKYVEIYILFIFLFAYTAFSKLLSIHAFAFNMTKSEIIRPYAKVLSYVVPITEILIVLLLLQSFVKIKKRIIPTRLIGMYGSAILMLGFTIYVGYVLGFAKHIPCTCGGFINQMSWKQHLVFNIFFLLLAIRGIYLLHKRNTLTV